MRNFLPFGRSPFGPIKIHMEKVHATARELRPFFDAFLADDDETATAIRKRILKLEHEADLAKNELREHLPKSYFLPVDRRDLLELLHTQDGIADAAEDIVVVATLRDPLSLPADLQPGLVKILDMSLDVCEQAVAVVADLDDLFAASFGGAEADAVLEKVARIGAAEHEVDKEIYRYAKELYRREQDLGTTSLLLWQKILELIGRIPNKAESVGDHLRLMMVR